MLLEALRQSPSYTLITVCGLVTGTITRNFPSLHESTTQNPCTESAQGNLARRVSGSMASRRTQQAQGRGGVAEPGAGRIVEQLSKLFGYSFLISSVCSIFVSGISSLPLTKWDDKDIVPHADVALVSVLLALWIGVGVSHVPMRVAAADGVKRDTNEG